MSEHPILPYRRDARPTSIQAARAGAERAPTTRDLVLSAIRDRGAHGMADYEGVEVTGVILQTYSARRGELVRMGLVVPTKARRPTPQQRPAIVWMAAEHARPDDRADTAPPLVERVRENVARAGRVGITDAHLAQLLDHTPARITTVRRDLVRRGIVERAGYRIDDATGKRAMTWRRACR